MADDANVVDAEAFKREPPKGMTLLPPGSDGVAALYAGMAKGLGGVAPDPAAFAVVRDYRDQARKTLAWGTPAAVLLVVMAIVSGLEDIGDWTELLTVGVTALIILGLRSKRTQFIFETDRLIVRHREMWPFSAKMDILRRDGVQGVECVGMGRTRFKAPFTARVNFSGDLEFNVLTNEPHREGVDWIISLIRAWAMRP